MVRSACDRFTEAHFRHNGNERYIFTGDMERFEQRLREFEIEKGGGELDF
jgi:hypothetical protein